LGLVNFPGKDIKRGKRSKSLRELSCYSGTSKGTDISKHKYSQSSRMAVWHHTNWHHSRIRQP